MRISLVWVFKTLSSLSLLIGLFTATMFGIFGVVSSGIDSGLAALFGGAIILQSLIIGLATIVTWALLLAVSERLRVLYAIDGNTSALLEQLAQQEDAEQPR